MKEKIKSILNDVFWQLTAIYSVLILLIAFGLMGKYTLHFEIFALIIGVIGIFALGKEDTGKNINKKLHYLLIILGVVLVVGLRAVPYIDNSIPLGYDAGIYKYGIESFSNKGFGVEDWMKGAFEPGFLYLMFVLDKIFGSGFILIWLFILFNLALGISVYFCTKEYFGARAGIIAFLLYAVSVIQFKVFSFMYYKNILGLIFMLWALVFFKKEKRLRFIVLGVLTGLMHRPTFFIFGLAYIGFTIKNWKEWKTNVRDGVLILAFTGIGYIGFWERSILPLIYPVAESFIAPGNSPGTFVSFFAYQFSTLAYLPFAIFGFGCLAMKKKFNALFFWAVINAAIVYFQFFFFNRFIIHLDIALIILAGVGFSVLTEKKKKFGVLILIVMLFSAGFVTLQEARKINPLISSNGLEVIESLKETVGENGKVMVISSEYSPWVVGYSGLNGNQIIAPGLFDENKWNEEEWMRFWNSGDEDEIKLLMENYTADGGEIYLFTGTKRFNNSCFTVYLENEGGRLYKYEC